MALGAFLRSSYKEISPTDQPTHIAASPGASAAEAAPQAGPPADQVRAAPRGRHGRTRLRPRLRLGGLRRGRLRQGETQFNGKRCLFEMCAQNEDLT